MFPFQKSETGFLPLAQENRASDETSDSERGGMSEHQYPVNKSRSQSRRVLSSNIPWVLSTIALSLYIFLNTILAPSPQKSHEPWSPTDLVYVRPMIEESIRTFTTGLDYDNQNHTLQHTASDGLRFVGPPSPEIDAAWEEIAGTQETFLTKEEAVASLVEDTYISPLTGLPVVEIESFHHLHCLNYIRKTIDIEHYPDIQEQETKRIHVEHCINSIREFIMCKADMTPIVLVKPEKAGVPVPVPEFRTKHVCRNFEELSSWVKRERSANLPEEESRELARRIREMTGTRY